MDDVAYPIAYLMVWIVGAVLVAHISDRKGRDFWGTFLLSLFLSPLIGVAVALIQKSNVKRQEDQAIRYGGRKKCPSCAELVKTDALVCRFCQQKLAVPAELRSYRAEGADGGGDGAQSPAPRCPKCEAVLDSQAHTCKYCRARLQ